MRQVIRLLNEMRSRGWRPGRHLMVAVAGFAVALTALNGHADADRVRFCFNAWPPYAYVEGGAAAGLSVEVLNEAARRAGMRAEFHERPWKRCLLEVRNGQMDAALDAASRDEFLQGPVSYSLYSNTFWVQQDSPIKAFELNALSGKTVGLVTGYSYPDELAKDPPFSVDFSVDDDTNLRKLAAGRVDAIVADLVSAKLAAEKHGFALRPLLPSHSFDTLYPSFNKERGDLQSRINAALAAMREDGFIARVYRLRLNLEFSELFRIPD